MDNIIADFLPRQNAKTHCYKIVLEDSFSLSEFIEVCSVEIQSMKKFSIIKIIWKQSVIFFYQCLKAIEGMWGMCVRMWCLRLQRKHHHSFTPIHHCQNFYLKTGFKKIRLYPIRKNLMIYRGPGFIAVV